MVKSVCPYCAVGCGQKVYVKDGRILDIEGDEDSPVSRGHLCPKGAATFQLVTGSHRLQNVLYRQVLLTAAGAEIIARARQVLTGADDLILTARQLGDPLAGTLRIGVIPTISPYLLPRVVPALKIRFPRLTLLWREDKTGLLLRDLGQGRLDAVVLAVVPEMEEFDREIIAEDRFVLAGPPGHPLLRARKPAQPGELEGESILLLEEGHCFRDQALAICTMSSAQEADFRATSLSTLAQMVAGGAGVTLLPELSLEVENRRGELAIRRFARPVPSRTIAFLWRRQSPLGAGLCELGRAIREAQTQRSPH